MAETANGPLNTRTPEHLNTGRTAFLFPGQGSQKVGMGREFYENTAIGRELFDQADAILGFPLTQLCFEGPDEALASTDNTQPAIFTVRLAMCGIACRDPYRCSTDSRNF